MASKDYSDLSAEAFKPEDKDKISLHLQEVVDHRTPVRFYYAEADKDKVMEYYLGVRKLCSHGDIDKGRNFQIGSDLRKFPETHQSKDNPIYIVFKTRNYRNRKRVTFERSLVKYIPLDELENDISCSDRKHIIPYMIAREIISAASQDLVEDFRRLNVNPPPKRSFEDKATSQEGEENTKAVQELRTRIKQLQSDVQALEKSKRVLEQLREHRPDDTAIHDNIQFYTAKIQGVNEELHTLREQLAIHSPRERDKMDQENLAEERKLEEERLREEQRMERLREEQRMRREVEKEERKDKRMRVIGELIQTEKDFLTFLHLIKETFLSPVAEKHKEVDVEHLFGNIEEVAEVSQKLLTKLEDATNGKDFSQQVIGTCFVYMAEDMKKVYALYCRNHDDVITFIEKYYQNADVKTYLERLLDRLRERHVAFNLEALLIKPVQRILKYPLQLNELIKSTEDDHRDKKEVMQAIKAMRDVATAINEFKHWNYCLTYGDLDGISDLINNKFYPNKDQLQQLCKTIGRKHPLMTTVCTRICEWLKEDKSIKKIWPAYETRDETDVIFVVDIDSKETNDFVNKFNVRISQPPNKEDKEVMEYELDHFSELDCKVIDQISSVIKEHEQHLGAHSNLTRICSSPIKSIGYGLQPPCRQKLKQYCIVLYVPDKGLIPLQEEPFPNKLGDFETDVREGDFKWQNELKTGSPIATYDSRTRGFGTLGGFVKNSSTLYGLTCAHVLLTDDELDNPSNVKTRLSLLRRTNGQDHIFGFVENDKFKYDTRKGVDAALIQKNPTSSMFPELNGDSTLKPTPFIEVNASNFNTYYKKGNVIKFGARTFKTQGSLVRYNSVVKYDTSFFWDQIVILSQSMFNEPFSKEGDSGSPVFIQKSEDDLVAIGIVTGGDKENALCSCVNKITNIFQAFGFESPEYLHERDIIKYTSLDEKVLEWVSQFRSSGGRVNVKTLIAGVEAIFTQHFRHNAPDDSIEITKDTATEFLRKAGFVELAPELGCFVPIAEIQNKQFINEVTNVVTSNAIPDSLVIKFGPNNMQDDSGRRVDHE